MLVKRKEEGDFAFGTEDLPYYVKKIKEKQCDLDFGVVKQYFPVNLVLSGIFKICQDLFGNHFDILLELYRSLVSFLSRDILCLNYLCLVQA